MFQREGTGKIRDFWEKKFMLLFQECDNGVAHKVKQDDEGDSKFRLLHRNMFMKINGILENFD